MPYKLKDAHRYKIPKAKYRVTNWSEYDRGLVQRGDVCFWIDEAVIAEGSGAWSPLAKDFPSVGFHWTRTETGFAARMALFATAILMLISDFWAPKVRAVSLPTVKALMRKIGCCMVSW